MSKIKGAVTKLEEAVQAILNEKAEDYEELMDLFADLNRGGCQSGMIGELIYTSDTVAFYQEHRKEIDGMLRDLCDDLGETPAQLFKRVKWEEDDFFARGDTNQNILAWFGFEETARKLAYRNGIEV